MTQKFNFAELTRWPLLVKNDSGSAIPPYSCVRVTGTEATGLGGELAYIVDKPTGSDPCDELLLTGRATIPASSTTGYGRASSLQAYATWTGTTPAIGDSFNPLAGSFAVDEATDGGGCFTCIGIVDTASKVMAVQRSSAAAVVCEDDPEEVAGTITTLALSADRSLFIEIEHSFRISVGPDGCVSLGISAETTGQSVPNCCESIPSVPSGSCSSGTGGLDQAAVCHGLARVGGFGGGAPRSRTGTYFAISTIAAYVGGVAVTELNDGDTVEIRADFVVRSDYGADDVTGTAALCGTGIPGADVGSLYVDSTVGVAANEVSADIANYVDCFEKGTTYHLRKTYTITFLGGGCPQRSIVWNALVGPGMGAGGGCSVVAAAGHLVFNSTGDYTCPTEVTNAVGPNAPCTTSGSSGGGGPSTSSGGGGVSGGFSSLGGGLNP